MLVVCSLAAAPMQLALHDASHVVSLLSPESQWPKFPVAQEHHLRLSLNDVTAVTPGLSAPRSTDAEKLITFLKSWNQSKPLLIHCWAGVSRSTAAAYTAMCLLRDEPEDHLAWELRQRSPSATPNRLLIKHVDHLLGRQGRMEKAIENIGRGADAFEGAAFVVPIKTS
jgi:predicted protein tyrosine phosphatase